MPCLAYFSKTSLRFMGAHRFIALLGFALLLLTGCGGGGSSSTQITNSSPPNTAPPLAANAVSVQVTGGDRAVSHDGSPAGDNAHTVRGIAVRRIPTSHPGSRGGRSPKRGTGG